MPIITNNFEGKTGGIHQSAPHDLDEQHSHAFGRSTYAKFLTGQRQETAPKRSDDKVITGYNRQGLPFQLIVDGFFQGATDKIFNFIDQDVLPLMDDYADELASAKDPNEVTKTLICRIAMLRAHKARDSEFTLSIVNTYQKDGQNYAAGFGIGDTAIVCKQVSGEITQLVAHTMVDGFKDAFDEFSELTDEVKFNTVVQRNDLFDVKLQVGDELVGYTSLPELMEQESKEFKSKHINSRLSQEQTIKKYYLNTEALEISQGKSFFSQIVDCIDHYFNKQCDDVERDYTGHFGDDCTLAGITIPGPELQNKMGQLCKIDHIKIATKNYLSWMESNAIYPRFKHRFSHIFHGDSGRDRAKNILNMIECGNSYEDISKALCEAFDASGDKQHSYSRYLVEALSGEKVLEVGVNEKTFKSIKANFNLSERLLTLPEDKGNKHLVI